MTAPVADDALCSPAALAALGRREINADRFASALALFDRSLAVRPNHPGTLHCRGIALEYLGQRAEALASVERALTITPSCMRTWKTYAKLLHRAAEQRGDRESLDAAAHAYHQAASLGADPEHTAFALASLDAAPLPATAPRAYVEGLFDDYAPAFDSHLREGLGYRTPELLVSALVRRRGTAPADIVDLGCGTGLCGPLLRTFARTLAGVDLSTRMLDLARGRGCYDVLAQADAVEHLRLCPSAYDLVIAADVLVYIGDLCPLLGAAHDALRDGGWLAVSVERHVGDGFTLRPSRRYAHSSVYFASSAAAAGFEVEAMLSTTLRMDAGAAVKGDLALLRRLPRVSTLTPCLAPAQSNTLENTP